jgi:UDP-glucose 4-epimerase
MSVLVVGEGLLGSAVRRAVADSRGVSHHVPWHDPDSAVTELEREIGAHLDAVGEGWAIAWCAGSGVVGSAAGQFAAEERFLAAALRVVAARPDVARSGAFFLASSAGGVHGGGSRSLLTEEASPNPVSAYGISKLAQEAAVTEWAARAGVPTLIGRISNLFGPSQNLGKHQGFVSHLCDSMLRHRVFTLSVPAETQRDFVHVDDVAGRIALWLARRGAGRTDAPSVTTKLLVAGRSTSLAQVIAATRAASGIQPRVVFAANAASALQPRMLRFRSNVLRDLDLAVPARSIEVGIKQTWMAMLQEIGRGQRVSA